MQPGRVVEAFAQSSIQTPEPQQQHGHAQTDHDAEGPEDDLHGRPVGAGDGVQTGQGRVRIVLQDQGRQLGDLDRTVDGGRLAVRNAEQNQRRPVRVAFEMAFHRHYLGGLMLQGVQPVHVADENLDRGGDQDHAHGHGEHLARPLVGPLLHQVPGPDRADHEAGGQIGRQQHVGEAIGEGGIEDDLEPVGRYELADLVDGVALRRLHPAVHRQDPEGRGEGADRDHQGGQEV